MNALRFIRRQVPANAPTQPAGSAVAPGTVRRRLLRIVLLTTAIALSVAGIALLTQELYVYRTSWAEDLATEAAILTVSVTPALAFDDHAAAETALKALEPRRRVTVAALYTAAGTLYASYVRFPGDAPPAAPPAEGIRISRQRIEITRIVERNGEIVGWIYLRSQYEFASVVPAYASIFALVLLLGLGVALLLSRPLQRGITDPLDNMAAVARAIKLQRDYSLRATKMLDDEIGVVIDAFNGMLDEIQSGAQALREADRRKDEFLATLAHELRNPLAPIRQAVRLLQSNDLGSQQREWAQQVISRQVQRMALLLDDLLDVSRITRGRLELKIEPVELRSLVDTAVETSRPLIDAKRHVMTIEIPANSITLSVDPLRLSQALSNLLTNAAKYMDAGGHITLAVALLPDEISMSVTDTGVGLAPGSLPGLFEMFSQVESAIDRSEGGLGIGLALVKGLVGLHGGTVDAHSDGPGRGSRFTIHLPRSAVVQALDVPRPEASEDRRNGSARGKVLVADDNRDAADSLAILLELNGHEVAIANTGQSALATAERLRPRAAILDIGMPDITGYEVARRLRAAPWGTGMYLIAVTGWGQTDDKARALEAGFDHHLTKPVDPDDLEKLLHAHFNAAR